MLTNHSPFEHSYCATFRGLNTAPPGGPNAPCTQAISSISAADGVTVITVVGDVDLVTSANVRAELLWLVRTGEPTVILDLCKIRFLGLAGLDGLMDARAAGCSTGRRILLVTGTRSVDRLLELTGLSATVKPYPTLTAALADVVPSHPHPL